MNPMHVLVLAFTLLTPIASFAQRGMTKARFPRNTTAQNPRSHSQQTQTAHTKTAIRRVDFLNFTYHPTYCNEVIEIGATVRVRNGRFRSGTKDDGRQLKIYNPKYGDLTNDGLEEAVLPGVCEPVPNNTLYVHEIFVYTMRNGAPQLLARLADQKLGDDYKRYFPDSPYDGANVMDSKINKGILIIPILVDGPLAGPENIAWMQYRWNGESFVLTGKPKKTKVSAL
jgi:hypothetical protein